jgi:hypothetical protein
MVIKPRINVVSPEIGNFEAELKLRQKLIAAGTLKAKPVDEVIIPNERPVMLLEHRLELRKKYINQGLIRPRYR